MQTSPLLINTNKSNQQIFEIFANRQWRKTKQMQTSPSADAQKKGKLTLNILKHTLEKN